MLKNITENAVKMKYNGKVIEVEPKKGVDVRDFDVANKDVLATEKHIMNKYPATFEQKKSVGDPERDKALDAEIKDLNDKIKALTKENDSLRKANTDLSNKNETNIGEKQNLKNQVSSLKTDNDSLLAKFKDMEEEIEKLRLEMGTGKKNKK